jgi:hypothetical protein
VAWSCPKLPKNKHTNLIKCSKNQRTTGDKTPTFRRHERGRAVQIRLIFGGKFRKRRTRQRFRSVLFVVFLTGRYVDQIFACLSSAGSVMGSEIQRTDGAQSGREAGM